jgi:hypothetical protein
MRNSTRLASLAFFAASALLTACNGDTISHGRADVGGLPKDAGVDQPLQLKTGMTFVYHGILTYREAQLGSEENSQYMITLTIGAVDDQGAQAESTLQFTASNPQTIMAQNWTAVADYDSWVARLGPSEPGDSVSIDPVTSHLSQIPAEPPRGMTKSLPQAGVFFLDTRKMDQIRAGFSSMFMSQMPQTVDPSMNLGSWRFNLSGPDATVSDFYPMNQKTRTLELDYDPRGFLNHIEETIGDTSMRPNLNARIDLMSGP